MEACVSKGATIQTHSWGLEPRQQPFTILPCHNAPYVSQMGIGPPPPTGAWGPAVDVSYIDGGRSRILHQHLPGARHRRF
jgi:hypothetical protein